MIDAENGTAWETSLYFGICTVGAYSNHRSLETHLLSFSGWTAS
jgi:hypothetical protein